MPPRYSVFASLFDLRAAVPADEVEELSVQDDRLCRTLGSGKATPFPLDSAPGAFSMLKGPRPHHEVDRLLDRHSENNFSSGLDEDSSRTGSEFEARTNGHVG